MSSPAVYLPTYINTDSKFNYSALECIYLIFYTDIVEYVIAVNGYL